MNSDKKQGFLNIDSRLYRTRISKKFENREKYIPVNPKLILSHIPGTVLNVFVSTGQEVKKGDVLMILDAMKMKNNIKCNLDGRIKSVPVSTGAKVSKGTVLVELD